MITTKLTSGNVGQDFVINFKKFFKETLNETEHEEGLHF